MLMLRNVVCNKGWNLIKDDLQTTHFIPFGICGMLPLPLVCIAILLEILHFFPQIDFFFYFHWLSHSLTASKWFSIHNLFTSTSSIAFIRRFYIGFFETHLLHGFDRRAKLISMLVKQVLQLQQIFWRRALFTSSHHLKARLAFVSSWFSPRLPCSSHCRQRSLHRSQKSAATWFGASWASSCLLLELDQLPSRGTSEPMRMVLLLWLEENIGPPCPECGLCSLSWWSSLDKQWGEWGYECRQDPPTRPSFLLPLRFYPSSQGLVPSHLAHPEVGVGDISMKSYRKPINQ